MKPVDIRYYPLPNGEFVVSYFDSLRRERVSETFQEEWRATETYNRLRMWKPAKEQKRSLKQCSIEDLLGIYLEEVPDASMNRSRQLMRDFLASFALHRPDQIDELAMRSFYQRQKLEYDYTNHSISTIKYRIQGFFKWMVSRGLIADSPQSKITIGRGKVFKRQPVWMKPHEIQKVLADAKKHSPGFLYPMLLLIHETAAKTSDIIELKWQDIDLKEKRVLLREGEKIQLRTLPISDELVNLFKSMDRLSERVFTNLEGRPLYMQCLIRELRMFKRQVGIEQEWVFRDLRHSFAVNFLKAGGSLEELQKVVGHWHVQLTRELYGRYQTSKADFFDVEVVPETGTSRSENNGF